MTVHSTASGRVLAASVVLTIRRAGAEYDRMREVEAKVEVGPHRQFLPRHPPQCRPFTGGYY